MLHNSATERHDQAQRLTHLHESELWMQHWQSLFVSLRFLVVLTRLDQQQDWLATIRHLKELRGPLFLLFFIPHECSCEVACRPRENVLPIVKSPVIHQTRLSQGPPAVGQKV